MDTLQAVVETIIFQNDDNGYTVLEITLEDGESASAVGVMPLIQSGERVTLSGEWSHHATYGPQFKVAFWEPVAPSDQVALERYLASGAISGIGPLTARHIVKRFGMQSLDALLSVEKLCEVPGIGRPRAQSIVQHFHEQQTARASLMFLSKYGISAAQSMRVFQKYGTETERLIAENPYRLIWEMDMGFQNVDRIARIMGYDPHSPHRLAAGIQYVLTSAANEGHTHLPLPLVLTQVTELLMADSEETLDALHGAVMDNQLALERTGESDEDTRVYLMPYHIAELGMSARLTGLMKAPLPPAPDKIDVDIAAFEIRENLEFAQEQRQALEAVLRQGVTLVTGGPGTGKTTITRALLHIAERCKWKAALAAPTGRAAKRMTEAAGQEAKTIHRLLEYSPNDEGELEFQKDEKHPLDIQLLIIDEMSMVDLMLMHHLLKAVPVGTRVIMLGDADQLPSVGAGSVLRDLTASQCVPTVHLTHIYRQAEASMIVTNAHRINAGDMPVCNEKDKDFYFQKCQPQDIAEAVVGLCTRRLTSYYGFTAAQVQVLCPMKKGPAGVYALNAAMQQALNPPAQNKTERKLGDTCFRVGDRVMQIKNNYQLRWVQEVNYRIIDEGEGVYNGDVGVLKALDPAEKRAWVLFDDDKEVEYEYGQMDELELAYAISIHKSQGSEFPAIVIPLTTGPARFMTRNLLYTAVTRAKQLVVVLGNDQMMRHMVGNPMTWERYSSLAERLQQLAEI